MKAAVLRGPGSVPEYADFEEPPVQSGREVVDLVAAEIGRASCRERVCHNV